MKTLRARNNSNSTLKSAFLACSIFAISAAGSFAGVISYSDSVSNQLTDINTLLHIDKFDSTKFSTSGMSAVLRSVGISLSDSFSTTLTVTNEAASASDGSVNTRVKAYLVDPGKYIDNASFSTRSTSPYLISTYSDDQFYTLSPHQSLTLPLTSVSSSPYNRTFTLGSVLDEFTGADQIALEFFTYTGTTLSNNGGNTSASQVTHASANLTVTYTYDLVPVPEPGQVAASVMLLGGFGGFVFIRRRSASKQA
jgi:hypothetical protein